MPDKIGHKTALSWGQAVILCGQMAAYQFIKTTSGYLSFNSYLPELCHRKDKIKFSNVKQISYNRK